MPQSDLSCVYCTAIGYNYNQDILQKICQPHLKTLYEKWCEYKCLSWLPKVVFRSSIQCSRSDLKPEVATGLQLLNLCSFSFGFYPKLNSFGFQFLPNPSNFQRRRDRRQNLEFDTWTKRHFQSLHSPWRRRSRKRVERLKKYFSFSKSYNFYFFSQCPFSLFLKNPTFNSCYFIYCFHESKDRRLLSNRARVLLLFLKVAYQVVCVNYYLF